LFLLKISFIITPCRFGSSVLYFYYYLFQPSPLFTRFINAEIVITLGRTKRFYEVLGGFVWGDVVVFGLFWFLVSIAVLYLQDWILFLLIVSLFWLVRSLGETIYWLNQQFTPRSNNHPKQYLATKIFKNDSVWFAHQIFWQCVTVVTIITSIYLAKLWLTN